MPRKPPIWDTQPNLPQEHLKASKRALRRRHPQRAYYPTIIGVAIALCAIPLTLITITYLPYQTWLGDREGMGGPQGPAIPPSMRSIVFAVTIGFPAAAGLLVANRLYRHWMHPILRDHFTRPRCVFCGYDLKGHAHTNSNLVTCPECGKDSPRIPSSATPG